VWKKISLLLVHLKYFLIFNRNERQFLDLETCYFISEKKNYRHGIYEKLLCSELEIFHNKSNSQVLAKQTSCLHFHTSAKK